MRKQINHARRHATLDVAELRRRGYQQIGKGAFSRAFVHPDAPDVVVKVGRIFSHTLQYADGFPAFATKILEGEIRSKFYPRIYDLRWSPDRDRFLCIMKRYGKGRKHRKTATSMQATLKSLKGERYIFDEKPNPRFRHALNPFSHPMYCADLHKANVLQDERGTPIMVDPVCIEWRYRYAAACTTHPV